MDDNQHPADELFAIRNTIRVLKAREEELRRILFELPRREREGRSYFARVVEKTRKVLDVERVEQELGDLDSFYVRTPMNMIYLDKLKEDEKY